MSFFKDILDKLGLGHQQPNQPTPTSVPPASPQGSTAPLAPATPTPAQPAVDVTATLDSLAKQRAETLNWRTSVVDLLKVLGIDSSLDHRKALASELGCPTASMGDSAVMNQWLHKEVLRRVSENGGTVPSELI